MFAYLITSRECYGNLDNIDLLHFRQKLHYAHNKMAQFNKQPLPIKLKFASLRYHNVICDQQPLSRKEWNLIEIFLSMCSALDITPILNFSSNKLTILQTLYEQEKFAGIHLKESDMPLLETGILFKILPLETIKACSTPIIYSAHNLANAEKAIDLGSNFVTLSPIFYEKNGNKALGTTTLQKINTKLKQHIIALGGITTDTRISEIQQCGIAGFASISYFLE